MSKTSAKTLAKSTTAQITTLPATSINHSEDTIITLPSSKKTIVIQKGLPANMIAQLDNYLKTHKNLKTKNVSASPNAITCGLETITYWETEDQYKTASGKLLGIWTDYLTPSQCYDYGFNSLFISGSKDNINTVISNATSVGFNSRNLMVSLGDTNSARAIDIINNTTDVGYYFIDELIEKSRFGDSIYTVIPEFANLIYSKDPNDKLFLTSYDLPYSSTCSALNPYDGYEMLLGLPENNIYIQCDEYYGNCCGNTTYYWDTWQNYYGSKNISNWMNIVINNGSTGYYRGLCGTHSSDWSTLFGKANSYGMNNIWLYAYQDGNESAVNNFAYAAWKNGWVLQLEKQVTTVWKCIEYPSCTDCVYPSKGDWYIEESYYTGAEQYIAY